MKNHNILYIGVDENNCIKIGMTQQTPRARQSGSNYYIWCYAESRQLIDRKTLLICESLLRQIFKSRYQQENTDRFIRTDEHWLQLFIQSINYFNHCGGQFAQPEALANIMDDWDNFFTTERAIKQYKEEIFNDNSLDLITLLEFQNKINKLKKRLDKHPSL